MDGGRILCPIDFSEAGDAALETALSLARARNASLLLLHVVETWPIGMADVPASFTDRDMRDIQSALHDILADVRDLEIERHIELGRPADRIVEFARDQHVDLIVIGTHGRTGATRLLLGSVAEGVVQNSPCAVLTVKHPMAPLELSP